MLDDARPRPSRRTVSIWGSLVALIALLAVLVSPAAAATPADHVLATGLPSRTLTPGATNPNVTQATIHQTICVSGWTATIRPSSSYTSKLKVKQIDTYGFADHHLADYEEDHLISLELGGAPRDPLNLWPEPRHIRLADGTDVGGYAKDALENSLKRRVCSGTLSLVSAQHEIARNWVKYWKVMKAAGSPAPTPTPSPTPVATPTPTPAPMAVPAPLSDASVAAATAAGATAVCNDGTWSYSQTRSGTCSSHDGVYWWTGNLGPPGPG
jgi:hypothetical protein